MIPVLVRVALRELRHQPGFAVFFALNLALGLVGAITLAALQSSIEDTLADRSRSFLAADLRVASSRPLTPAELAIVDDVASPAATSSMIQLYSMIATPRRSRLVEVRGIDAAFPLSGQLVLSGAGTVDTQLRERLSGDALAWVAPSLPASLGIAAGETVKLGAASFTVTDTIVRDTGLSVRAVSLGPRIYVAADRIHATGLIQTGSRVEYQTLVSLRADEDATATAQALRAAFDDPALRVSSHEEATAAISGAYSRVTRYLGAISLIALCLAGVACAYSFRSYLSSRVADLAILMSLGASRRRAQGLLLVQLALLGAAGATVAIALAAVLLPAAARALADLLPAQVDLRVGLPEIATAYVVALLFGPLSCLPFLARLGRMRVADLFGEHVRVELAEHSITDSLWYLPASVLVFALALAQLGDVGQAAGFVGLIATAAAVIAWIARVVLGAVSTVETGATISWRLALRQLSPRRRASRTVFVALASSALLLCLPAQMRALLDGRLAPPPAEEIPSLFLFDIQPEQTEALRELVTGTGTRLQRMAPMIRARLDAINDEEVGGAAPDDAAPAARSELRDRERLRTRRYNLTYQSELADTEELVEGRDFSGAHDPASGRLPEISMEVDYARDLGVGVDDRLRFDIQGVPVEGIIVNLRSVDWNSMQPNFFVSFQPGVIEAAPAVFLASVPALPAVERDRLQDAIVDTFPNVSLIDVTRGIDRAIGLINQLQWALGATTATALLVGFLLVVAIARDEARARRADVNLLKVLGARHRQLRASVAAEFGLLAFAAALVGAVTAASISAALAHAFFDTDVVTAWGSLTATLVALPALAVVTAAFATRGVLAERPSMGLR